MRVGNAFAALAFVLAGTTIAGASFAQSPCVRQDMRTDQHAANAANDANAAAANRMAAHQDSADARHDLADGNVGGAIANQEAANADRADAHHDARAAGGQEYAANRDAGHAAADGCF